MEERGMSQEKVDIAIETVLKEVRRSIESLNQAGARAFQSGDYARAKELMEQGPRLVAFYEKVKDLPGEWRAIRGNGTAPAPAQTANPAPASSPPKTPLGPQHPDPAPARKPPTPPEPGRKPDGTGTLQRKQSGLLNRGARPSGSGLLERPIPARDSAPPSPPPHTSEEEFLIPILQALMKLGGAGSQVEVLNEIEQIMGPYLQDADYEPMDTDENTLRWQNSALWAKAAMAQEGLVSAESIMGIWQITETGREWLSARMGNGS